MKKITQLINEENMSVAVIGCCGKTTFINNWANSFKDKKVLISPTTKILPMIELGDACVMDLDKALEYKPQNGLSCIGLGMLGGQKMRALPFDVLSTIVKRFDLSLMEADGSRGFPCKGWRDDEPVIPDFVTHTVGIVTFKALGKPANAEYVHRLPLFLELTGLKENEEIGLENLAKMILEPKGLFGKAKGKVCLMVNQIENEKDEQIAKAWLEEIKKCYPNRFHILAYGSGKNDSWKEV